MARSPSRTSGTGSRSFRTAGLAAVAAAIVAADWLRLEEPHRGAGKPLLVVVLAIAPALLPRTWLRVAGALVSALVVSWLAFSASALEVWPGGHRFLGPLGHRFSSGFLDFYEFRLPIDAHQHPWMHGVILAALFGFSLAVALAVAARRAVLAVVCFLVGAGWPATLLTGGHELARGAVILGGALVVLAGLCGRPGRLAIPVGGALVLSALALSTSPAVAKTAFLDWQHWRFATPPQKPVSVRYVWDSDYSGIRFPPRATTVLRIKAGPAPLYWRATTLDEFAADRWVEHLIPNRPGDGLVPRRAGDRRSWTRQEVTVEALDDQHLVGATVPVAYAVDQPVDFIGQGVATAQNGLHRGQTYTVWSYAPTPTPRQLIHVGDDYPGALTRAGADLELAPRATAPAFGVPGRDAVVRRLLSGRLSPYRLLYDRALAVAGQTSSPYAAAVAIETWLRSSGGFVYSEQPPPTGGVPALVAFVTRTKEGYCQHFAGAMALMLRTLGIPSRVAVGFTSGAYAHGEWNVTDHAAHAWVEVWFRGYGWLPFDPTPGRGRLAGTYTSASQGFRFGVAARLLAGLVKGGEVFGAKALVDHPEGGPRSTAEIGARKLTALAPAHHRHSLLRFLLVLALAVAGGVVLAKLLRRRARYLTRDPRRIAVACGQELADFLLDQRLDVPRGGTVHELGGVVAGELAVDAEAFADAVTAARFGPPARSHEAARRARIELRELKRNLRRRLDYVDRARGSLSLRSLGFS